MRHYADATDDVATTPTTSGHNTNHSRPNLFQPLARKGCCQT